MWCESRFDTEELTTRLKVSLDAIAHRDATKAPQPSQAKTSLYSVVVTTSVGSATGIELFHQHWIEYYLSDRDDESAQPSRRLDCNVHRVKGENKKTHRNECGQALESLP